MNIMTKKIRQFTYWAYYRIAGGPKKIQAPNMEAAISKATSLENILITDKQSSYSVTSPDSVVFIDRID